MAFDRVVQRFFKGFDRVFSDLVVVFSGFQLTSNCSTLRFGLQRLESSLGYRF